MKEILVILKNSEIIPEKGYFKPKKWVFRKAYPRRRDEVCLRPDIKGFENGIGKKSSIQFQRFDILVVKRAILIIRQDVLIDEVFARRGRDAKTRTSNLLAYDRRIEKIKEKE